MEKHIEQLKFSSVEEFGRLLAGFELVFVIFQDGTSVETEFLKALGDLEPGEKCYFVDATSLVGRCHDYFLVHSPVAKRIDPKLEGEIRRPFALAVIPGVGFICSSVEMTDVTAMLNKARHEKIIFQRGKS